MMEQILQPYGLPNEAVTAMMILYKNMKAVVFRRCRSSFEFSLLWFYCWLFNVKSILIHINGSISNNSVKFKCQKHFYFKLFSLVNKVKLFKYYYVP